MRVNVEIEGRAEALITKVTAPHCPFGITAGRSAEPHAPLRTRQGPEHGR